MLSDPQIAALMSPINPQRVAKRSQGGKTLSYVEAWEIKAALIRLFGFGGFNAEVIDSKIVDVREGGRQGQYTSGIRRGEDKAPQVIAQASVRLTLFGIGPDGQDAVYCETAIGANSGPDIGETADNAIKTAASDALKRCAIYLGSQFGLSLYDNGSTSEVVRRMIEPEQAEALERIRKAVAPPPAQAQTQISQAMGGTWAGHLTDDLDSPSEEPSSEPEAQPQEDQQRPDDVPAVQQVALPAEP